MSRAAAFKIDWRRSSRYECTPNIALLQKSSREHTNACTKVSSALRVNEWRTTRIRRRWKKQTCESLVMWSTIDRSWSRRRPRFRVTLSDTIAAEMLQSVTVSRFPSCCLVPNHRYFVLSKWGVSRDEREYIPPRGLDETLVVRRPISRSIKPAAWQSLRHRFGIFPVLISSNKNVSRPEEQRKWQF